MLLVASTALLVLAARVLSAPRFDAGLAVQLHAGRAADYDWAVPVTDLGGAPAILMAIVIFGGLFVLLRQLRFAAVLGLAFVLDEGSAQVLKRVIERPRPGHPLVEAAGYSFPSGHATASLAVYGTLVYIAARTLRGPVRIIAVTVGLTVVAAVGFSRVYLRAHYPSDVIGSWLLGLLGIAMAWSLTVPTPEPRH